MALQEKAGRCRSSAPFVPGTVILLNLHINQRILIIPSLRPSALPLSTTRRRNLH